jgi:hypothetical protein
MQFTDVTTICGVKKSILPTLSCVWISQLHRHEILNFGNFTLVPRQGNRMKNSLKNKELIEIINLILILKSEGIPCGKTIYLNKHLFFLPRRP